MSLEIGDGRTRGRRRGDPGAGGAGDLQAVRVGARARERVAEARARVGARAARRERRRQEHARQVHHGLLPGRRGAGAGERRRRGHQEPARRGRARHRHGLPALHAGRQHDGGREPGPGAPRAPVHLRLGGRAEGGRRLHGADAVQARSGAPGAHAGRRREAEARDPEAALSRQLDRDPRRADVGADAGRGRRRARPPARDGAGRAPDHPHDLAQVPRGDGVRRRGDRAAAGEARRERPRRRSDPRRDGADDGRRRAAERERDPRRPAPARPVVLEIEGLSAEDDLGHARGVRVFAAGARRRDRRHRRRVGQRAGRAGRGAGRPAQLQRRKDRRQRDALPARSASRCAASRCAASPTSRCATPAWAACRWRRTSASAASTGHPFTLPEGAGQRTARCARTPRR